MPLNNPVANEMRRTQKDSKRVKQETIKKEKKQEVKEHQLKRMKQRLKDSKADRRDDRGIVDNLQKRRPQNDFEEMDKEMTMKTEPDYHYTTYTPFYPMPMQQAVNPLQVAYNNAQLEQHHG